MQIVIDTKILKLRSLETVDIDWLLSVENNTEYWAVSGTTKPFTKETITSYVQHAQESISTALQYRFVIEKENIRVGLIDLFDYNRAANKVGVGVLVLKPFQNTGIGNQALHLLIDYCITELKIKLIYANISTTNLASVKLFRKHKFRLTERDFLQNNLDKNIFPFYRICN
jgi:diamine N-acetyltransferase